MDNETVWASLHIVHPDGSAKEISITVSPFNVGRTADNHLQLPDQLISRHHARLLYEAGRFHLIDLNSSNGTIVGDTRLAPNDPHTIAYGEAFSVGPYTLHLEAVPVAAEKPESDREVKPPDVPSPEVKSAPRVQIGATEAPPPPPPREGRPIPDNGMPSYEEAFGLPTDFSRYLQYLPPIYSEHPFVGRFLLAFEGVMVPVEQIVDHFDLHLNPQTAPAPFLDELAGWLGLTLDEKWPEEKRRIMLTEAVELYRRRGTCWGLTRHLAIYAGIPLDDQASKWIQIAEPEDRPHHFHVTLHKPSGEQLDRSTLERIIETNKPAHTTYSMEILEDEP